MPRKTTYQIALVKNQEKGGSWLASVKAVGVDDIPTRYSAWSSAAPAKRWAASILGRGRLPWLISEDKKSMNATVEVKTLVEE